MNDHPKNDEKSCDPQLFDPAPQKDWGLDQLGDYVRTQNDAIAQSERLVTPHYWRLGLALNLARRHFSRGQWGKFLQELGIDKTRASKACAIHRTFKQQESVEGLSVQAAYQRRERKSRKFPAKKRQNKQHQSGIAEWLLEVCKNADFFLDEAAFIDPREAASLLPAIDGAIEELTSLRTRVQRQADAA